MSIEVTTTTSINDWTLIERGEIAGIGVTTWQYCGGGYITTVDEDGLPFTPCHLTAPFVLHESTAAADVAVTQTCKDLTDMIADANAN